MIVFVATLLTVLTFIFVTYPLFRRGFGKADSIHDVKLEELHTGRDRAYSMLKELEFDFHSGLLSEGDYHELEKSYKQKAISILKDVDRLREGTDVDTDVDEEIERQVAELRQRKRGRFCSQCGAEYQEEDRFCAQCGARLR